MGGADRLALTVGETLQSHPFLRVADRPGSTFKHVVFGYL
jgi:hypothetical protein